VLDTSRHLFTLIQIELNNSDCASLPTNLKIGSVFENILAYFTLYVFSQILFFVYFIYLNAKLECLALALVDTILPSIRIS
jgi:hypothetical protein